MIVVVLKNLPAVLLDECHFLDKRERISRQSVTTPVVDVGRDNFYIFVCVVSLFDFRDCQRAAFAPVIADIFVGWLIIDGSPIVGADAPYSREHAEGERPLHSQRQQTVNTAVGSYGAAQPLESLGCRRLRARKKKMECGFEGAGCIVEDVFLVFVEREYSHSRHCIFKALFVIHELGQCRNEIAPH